MRCGVGYSTLLRIVLSLALLGAVLKSPIRVPLTAPVPSNFLRRNFSLCASLSAGTIVPLTAAPATARIKMIREKSEEGDRPVMAASAPLPPIAVSLAPSIGPPHSPSPSRPHLRC
jgi:hypothetical protein